MTRSAPLSQLTELISSGSTPRGGAENYDSSGEVMLIRSQNVHMNRLVLDDVVYVTRAVADGMARTYLRKGDVLLNITGASIGRVASFEREETANVNQHVCVIRPNRATLNHRYLRLFLSSPSMQSVIMGQQHGGTRQALTFGQIAAFSIPLPPLPEQRRIADILDKADAIRRKRKEAIALTEELLRAAFLEMFGDPVGNPRGWPVATLGNLATVTDGTHKTPKYVAAGVPFLSAKNIRANRIDWTNTRFITRGEHEELVRRCRPELGDVLLTKSGTIGEAARVDQAREFSLFESAALIKIKPSSGMTPELLVALLNASSTKQAYSEDVKGAGVKHLHLVDIRRLQVIVPPREAQARFTAFADRIKSTLARQAEAVAGTETLFSSLLDRAFRGELTA